MMEIKKENWFYCTGCAHVSYRFDCCGNSSCNGGGCDKCKEFRDHVYKLIEEGKYSDRIPLPIIFTETENSTSIDLGSHEDRVRALYGRNLPNREE